MSQGLEEAGALTGPMVFDILTLLPEVCETYAQASILGRAREAGLIEVRCTNIRDFATDRHHTVDDAPYGGGDGMVMMPGPLLAALESVSDRAAGPVLVMSPAGRPLDQEMVRQWAMAPRMTLVCGRYEGMDQRFLDLCGGVEVSLGDFVLTGGELAALAVVDAVSRLRPGVLGGEGSAAADSFSDGLLEHPHYTRPPEFRGLGVPEVLLSGHHAMIERWRRKESLRRTLQRRPELVRADELGKDDRRLLREIRDESGQA